MCNLYSMTANRAAILRLFGISHNRAADYAPQPAIFPGGLAPVIRRAGDGERELVVMSWGFPLEQTGRAVKRVTNAREDRVRQSPFWRGSLEARRCLVPATSFSEPKGRRPAVWYWFALDAARSPFAFAGLWRRWRGQLRSDGETQELDVFAFLTTQPNVIVAPVHPTRMPVMLIGQDAQETWLTGTPEQALGLARPCPPERMRIVATGSREDPPAPG